MPAAEREQRCGPATLGNRWNLKGTMPKTWKTVELVTSGMDAWLISGVACSCPPVGAGGGWLVIQSWESPRDCPGC